MGTPETRVGRRDASVSSKCVYRHISRDMCPWNVRFATALPADSPFAPREMFFATDSYTFAREILDDGSR